MTNGYLLTMMFVTILSFAIANLLESFAKEVSRKPHHYDWWAILWKVMLLLNIFNNYWHTRFINILGSLGYVGIFVTLFGPLITFFTARLISNRDFNPLRITFFSLILIKHLWEFTGNYILFDEVTSWIIDVIQVLLTLILVFSCKKNEKVFKVLSLIYALVMLLSTTRIAIKDFPNEILNY
ncbi:hypothetical protein [Sediminitomix flava]|nr:hypothetical protein [Sediminitomix flava]